MVKSLQTPSDSDDGMPNRKIASPAPIGALDPLDLAEAGSVFFTRPHLADYIATSEERNRRAADLYQWVSDGHLTVTIDRTFPLAEAKAAHDAIEGRKTKGKLLLDVGEGQGAGS